MSRTDCLYSVVIPVYNSDAIVSQTVSRVRDFFIAQGHSFEIILVNDGSRDRSWDVIAGLARTVPEVVAICPNACICSGPDFVPIGGVGVLRSAVA